MDLSKAFDCLPHDLLLGKLRAYGLNTSACALVSSYLSNRKQRVKLGPHHSEWANTRTCVPQYSILGPLLFNIFINDIFNILNTLIQVLQGDCSAILQWFDQNQMKANPKKCQAISFGKRGNRDITHFTCDRMYIPCEYSVSLLGVNFDHLLTFNNHITEIFKKAARQLAVLKRIGHVLTVQGTLTIYKSFMMSNFNYCPLIWHFCSQASTNKLEKIQERALRFIYNDHSSTYTELLKSSGTVNIHIKRTKDIACAVYKIVNKLAPSFIQTLVALKYSKYSQRRNKAATIPSAQTPTYGLKSFSHEGPRVWNCLPNEFRLIDNYSHFRRCYRIGMVQGATAQSADTSNCSVCCN